MVTAKLTYVKLKKQATALRKKGLSYGVIAKTLGISKSTVSSWLYSIKITAKQQKKLYSNQVYHLNFGPNSQRNRREREVTSIIIKAKTQISNNITLESYRLFGAALYWAEGSKKSMFCMTNSDPSLILFWVRWVEKIFGIDAKLLKAKLNIYPQQSDTQIRKFWSDLTSIPLKNFGKSYVKPLSKNYKKNNLYYGTIRIDVPKSTNYRHMVYAWKERILEDLAPDVDRVQRKWEKLQRVAKPVNMP